MLRKILSSARKRVMKSKPVVKRVRVVVDAPQGKEFFVFGGPVVHRLDELPDVLRSISPVQYEHHTENTRGNDFAMWIRDVFGQKRLAGRIEKAKTKEEAAALVDAYCS